MPLPVLGMAAEISGLYDIWGNRYPVTKLDSTVPVTPLNDDDWPHTRIENDTGRTLYLCAWGSSSLHVDHLSQDCNNPTILAPGASFNPGLHGFENGNPSLTYIKFSFTRLLGAIGFDDTVGGVEANAMSILLSTDGNIEALNSQLIPSIASNFQGWSSLELGNEFPSLCTDYPNYCIDVNTTSQLVFKRDGNTIKVMGMTKDKYQSM